MSNYKDVASNGLRKEARGKKERRRKRLVKHSESISSLCGVCMEREILTSDHHQTMENETKRKHVSAVAIETFNCSSANTIGRVIKYISYFSAQEFCADTCASSVMTKISGAAKIITASCFAYNKSPSIEIL